MFIKISLHRSTSSNVSFASIVRWSSLKQRFVSNYYEINLLQHLETTRAHVYRTSDKSWYILEIALFHFINRSRGATNLQSNKVFQSPFQHAFLSWTASVSWSQKRMEIFPRDFRRKNLHAIVCNHVLLAMYNNEQCSVDNFFNAGNSFGIWRFSGSSLIVDIVIIQSYVAR